MSVRQAILRVVVDTSENIKQATAGKRGRLFIASDESKTYYDDGTKILEVKGINIEEVYKSFGVLEFNPESTYSTDNPCYNNKKVYKFNQETWEDIEWVPEHWTETDLTDVVSMAVWKQVDKPEFEIYDWDGVKEEITELTLYGKEKDNE